MKKGLIFLIINLTLLSQSIDSLLYEIQSKPPEEKLEILTNELWANRSKNPNYAMMCGQKGIKLAEAIGDKSSLAKLNNLMGVIYRNVGNYTKALELYNNALNIAESINDSVQIAYSYNNIGGAYRLERNYTIALTNMFKAMEIFEKLKMNEGVAFCTINIGIVYRLQRNYEKALEYINRTIEIREKIQDNYGLAIALNQLGEIYYDQGKLDTVLSQYQELYNLYEELDDTKGIATVMGGMGGIFFEKGEYQSARNYREKALDLHRSIGNIEGIVNNLNGLTLIYSELNRIDLAMEAINEVKKICNRPSHVAFLIEYYSTKSKFFEQRNRPDSALHYFKKHTVLKDSLAAKENMMSIASMEAIYQVDLASRENEILINENKLKSEQTTFLLILAVLLISFISFGVMKYYSNKNLNKELAELNKTKDKFFSIVAHDLKNPFINLLGYSELLASDFDEMSEEDKKQAVSDLHNSSKKLLALVENLLQWSSANIGSLQYHPRQLIVKDEIDELIYLYSDAIKQKKLKVESTIDADLTITNDEDYFKLVMRNLISNAIKFSSMEARVKIFAEETSSRVLVSVQDFGVGIEEEKIGELFDLGSQKSTRGTMNESGTGLGLTLSKDLVTKWGGEITVQSKLGEGSTFIVSIPKK